MQMMLDCSQLATAISALPLVQQCDRGRSGTLRMSTPFKYPNGEHVDVFLDSTNPLFIDYELSDRGHTTQYLKNAQVGIVATSRRKELVSDILSGSRVRLNGAQLTIKPLSAAPDDLSEAIFRLSQMCVRISDLATHQRLRSTNAFKDDVEEFFEARGISYDTDVELPPVYGERIIRMDFAVRGKRGAYINVLGAMNEAAAHSSANEIFSKWYDLTKSGRMFTQNFVTVYNSGSAAVRPEDIERLMTLSSVVAYPEEPETLEAILREDGTVSA